METSGSAATGEQSDFLIEIPLHLHRRMQAHVEAAYPNEGCGIMVGTVTGDRGVLRRVVTAENQNTERGRDRFEIDPLLYMRTERELAAGESVIGFFHSHPDCPEVASRTDLAFARNWPGFIWLIYRVEQGTSAGLRSWMLSSDESGFEETGIRYTEIDDDDH